MTTAATDSPSVPSDAPSDAALIPHSPLPTPQSFQLGGQALIEGVMMRSPHFVGAAVRRADDSITTRVEPVRSVLQRHRLLNVPLLRGVIALFEMLALGMRYLNWSSNLALESETKPGAAPPAAPTTEDSADPRDATPAQSEPTGSELPWWLFALTIAASLGFGLFLFVALPNLITDWTLRRITDDQIALNLFEGLVKLAIFVGYVWLIGRRPNIRRVFEYHGAEHKVVYAVENGCPLTPAGARPFDTPHPRCGTGFALLTVFVSVFCFAFLPWSESHLARVAWRFALMPLVAGVSYEVIKLTTNPRWSALARLVLTPGLWLQRLTTRQPDDAQLEVSCAAMRAVLDAETRGAPL